MEVFSLRESECVSGDGGGTGRVPLLPVVYHFKGLIPVFFMGVVLEVGVYSPPEVHVLQAYCFLSNSMLTWSINLSRL